MEPKSTSLNEPNFTQDSVDFPRHADRSNNPPSPTQEALGVPESNDLLGSHEDNYFVGDNLQKRTIDDGVTMICEYITQEKICPNIMPYQEKLMAYLKEKIETQEMDVQRLSDNKNIDEKKKKFIIDLKSLEMESVKYLIKSYLRIRMLKIQKNSDYILKMELFTFLSMNEEKFVKEYHALKMDYLNKNCLNKLPSDFRNIGISGKEDKFENISVLFPNFSKFVFIKVKKTMNRVNLSNLEIDLIKDDIYILEYRSIKSLHELAVVELL